MQYRFTCSAVLLAATFIAAPALAADRTPNEKSREASADAPSQAVVLARIQERIFTLPEVGERAGEAATELSAALLAARGRPLPDDTVRMLAAGLTDALNAAFMDEELAERLAYDLYGALNPQTLDEEHAFLLLDDVTTLLRAAGAPRLAVQRVAESLQAICGVTWETPRQSPLTSTYEPLVLPRP